MANISEKHIEIDGKDYTLFLNRKGISSWENITKFSKKINELEEKYKQEDKKENNSDTIEIKDDTNPFEYSNSEEVDNLEKDEEELKQMYIKWYWIALYTNHKLSLSEVTELFEKAEEEYGDAQLFELANRMIKEANTNTNTNLKKLEALNQMK